MLEHDSPDLLSTQGVVREFPRNLSRSMCEPDGVVYSRGVDATAVTSLRFRSDKGADARRRERRRDEQ